jgi:hypothetical protein
MFLTREEAISFILACGQGKVSSKTKLNKLLARLNLHFVPVDIDFRLNQFGSFSVDLQMESTPHYIAQEYAWQGNQGTSLQLTGEGQRLAADARKKILQILSPQELNTLEVELAELHALRANEIADNEHRKLFVDVEDRHKLRDRVNVVHIDLLDLQETVSKEPQTFADITYAALVEYCFFLSKYLKERRFRNIENSGDYEFDSYMLDYYFLYNLEQAIPEIQAQSKSPVKDERLLNKLYQYFVNSAREYPFSLENLHLKELM